MNVLAKIVIPKTNVTMGYINNELEELAREEFFRLKKVLEIKRKMYGGKEKKKGKPEDLPICETCTKDIPVCETCMVEEEQDKISKDAIESEEGEPKILEEDKSLKLQEIEKLIKQLNEIVDVTKEIGDKGLVDVSVDEFIKTAEELREKLGQKSDIQQEESQSLPSDSSLEEESNTLCDACRAKYNDEQREKQSDKMSVGTQPSCSSQCSRETVQFKQSSSPSLSDNDSDSDLGTFETEYKEITKIIKTKNKDGSITIKKKVVKVEKETKSPGNKSLPSSSHVSYKNKSNMTHQSSSSSTKSNPYSGSKTVGLLEIKAATDIENDKIQRKVKSEVLTTFLPMSDPVERLCMSSITLLSTDLDIDLIRSENTKKDIFHLSNNEAEEFLSR
ncbi:unnamed protein product [Euphydryas editha]|uniref:Uncharacterized protein n=1 Tax=Euphydryas editha TaxID=104508 RepID=A0AAU9TBB1_EUPED|nr:unnamed protein product [Euphydryas editha]